MPVVCRMKSYDNNSKERGVGSSSTPLMMRIFPQPVRAGRPLQEVTLFTTVRGESFHTARRAPIPCSVRVFSFVSIDDVYTCNYCLYLRLKCSAVDIRYAIWTAARNTAAKKVHNTYDERTTSTVASTHRRHWNHVHKHVRHITTQEQCSSNVYCCR